MNLELFKAKFIEDATDLLTELEKKLLDLEQNPKDSSLIKEVFRTMHTLKGSCGMYGYDNIGKITHQLESIYDLIREGKAQVSRNILSTTLSSVDILRNLLNDDSALPEERAGLLAEISFIISQITDFPEESEKVNQPESETETGGMATYYILFQPDADISDRGINLKAIFEEIKEHGQTKVVEHSTDASDETQSTKKFYMYWEIFLASISDLNSIKEVFLFVEDEVKIQKIYDKDIFEDEVLLTKIDHLSEGHVKYIFNELIGYLKKEISEKIVADLKLNSPENSTQKIQNTLKEIQSQSKNFMTEQTTSSIRVSSERLDELMNLVSELVTTKAELSLIAEEHKIPRLISVAEKVEKLSKQFRDNALYIRLIPIESMIVRFERLVRDLSRELDKDVEFVTQGTDTELDKTIIDNLAIPIMHIIRNSMDHGIESNENRKIKGKSSKGIIKLTAFYSGADVFIQVQDDGAGIDPVIIREKAISKGFISANAVLSNKEIYDLIFLPGFSTAQSITGVSGRGVGMDVVKQKITNLRGEIEVDSEVGLGTSITIKLPLTLSIVDALWVKIDNRHFLIPLYVVDSCSEYDHDELEKAANNRVSYADDLVPFIYLRKEFGITSKSPEIERMVMVKYKERLVGLVVDQVVGEHQAVLKPLGEILKSLEILSGGSILGDGEVALVLDTNKFIKEYTKKK